MRWINKKRIAEGAIEKTISKLNVIELNDKINIKPMTAGFMTSRNKNQMLLSSDAVVKGKNILKYFIDNGGQLSPQNEEKFFEKRISTRTRATRCKNYYINFIRFCVKIYKKKSIKKDE